MRSGAHLLDLGRRRGALEALETARDFTTEVLLAQGRARSSAGQVPEAYPLIHAALALAPASQAGDLEARGWSVLLSNLALQARFDEGVALATAGELAVVRAQKSPLLEGDLACALGLLYHKQRVDLKQARQEYQSCRDKRELALGNEHPLVAAAIAGISSACSMMGRDREARPHYEQALAMVARTIGTGTVLYAGYAMNVGTVVDAEDPPRALACYQRALEVFAQVVPESAAEALAHMNLATESSATCSIGRSSKDGSPPGLRSVTSRGT